MEQEQIRGITYCFYSIRTYQFFVMLILSCIFGTLFSYTYKIYGENGASHPPISDETLTWAASIGSGFVNGASRIVIGTILDKVGFKTIMIGLMLIQLVISISCYWAVYVPALYFTSILLNFVVVSGIFTIFPVAVNNVFGLESGPQIYVWIMLGGFFAALINLLLTTVVLDWVGFMWLFYFGSFLTIVVLVMMYFYEEKLDVERLRRHNGLKSCKEKEKMEF